jgi:3-dehydroquinate synthase
MKKITVSASRKYDVIVGQGIMENAGSLLRENLSSGTAVIVTDDNVNALYGKTVEASLKDAGMTIYRFVFPHGEQSKCMAVYEKLLNFLSEKGITRGDVLVALGGGVAGDLGGFAAATYMRGIKLVQIPTTLIAMTDSSVGGKTAIDLAGGKNLCGAFYQPHLVICDTLTSNTLPRDVFRDGCGEIIKYGLLKSPELLRHLEENAADFDREYVIPACVEMKRDIVCKDELDTGLRQLLNLGHTAGHAFEKLSGYTLSHGSAVAMGIAVMAESCKNAGICSAGCCDKTISLMEKFGFELHHGYDFDSVMNCVLSDKKRSGSTLTWVVIEDYGKSGLKKGSINEFASFIESGVLKWK